MKFYSRDMEGKKVGKVLLRVRKYNGKEKLCCKVENVILGEEMMFIFEHEIGWITWEFCRFNIRTCEGYFLSKGRNFFKIGKLQIFGVL